MKKISLLVVATLVAWMCLPLHHARAVENCQDIVAVGAICLAVVDGRAVVTGPLGIDISADIPETIVEVPVPVYVEGPAPAPITIRETVTVPGPTVTRAPETVTTTQTVTEVSGTTATVTNFPRQRATEGDRLVVQTVEVPGKSGTETIFKNATIGIGLILLGGLAVLALMFIMYRIGHAGQEEQQRSFNHFMSELSNLTMIRKR